MKKQFILHSFQLDFLTLGKGADTILCFHGFGRIAEDFLAFQSLLKPCQRIVAINLFAHGGSIFPEERINSHPLELCEWKELLEAFFESENIHTCHLVGYSMGGRVAMTTLELMPERFESLLLIAPDGIKINLLYRFASGTMLGKWLYRGLIRYPQPLHFILDMLHKSHLLKEKFHRLVYINTETLAKRQQVYDAWLIHVKMIPNLEKIAEIVRSRKVRFNMVFGKYDSIIPPRLGKKLSDIIGSDIHYHEIESGHQLINNRTAKFLEERNLWPK